MALSETRPPESASRPRKALTIGAVCKILQSEFDDISISKIRYLEDQKLLTPRRTPGGYRLYTQSDVQRLRTILRLQRDEFLPLRVIRQELASPSGAGKERRRRRAVGLADPDQELDLAELCDRAAITRDLARESGFDTVKDLLEVAQHGPGRNIYLIRFRYLPPGGW